MTTPGHWDRFWDATRIPVLPDCSDPFDIPLIHAFERIFAPDPSLRVFEAGCAPGKWLAFFHRRFGFTPYGCDVSPRGIALTRENLRSCSIPGEVRECDILSYEPERPFDIVVSLGFIEHFGDPNPILDRHVDLLRPGGTLVVEVPNFRGLNAYLANPDMLVWHNQAVMTRDFLRGFALRRNLEVRSLEYAGGFQPWLLSPRPEAYFRRAVFKLLRGIRRLPCLATLNSPLFSAYLVGVFRKPLTPP